MSFFEYYVFENSKNADSEIFYNLKGSTLEIKFPFQMPYLAEARFYEHKGYLAVFEGEIYRSKSKIFSNDTLTTVFGKEEITGKGVFELINQVYENFGHKDTPLNHLNDFLKNLCKLYHNQNVGFLTFFWNSKLEKSNFQYLDFYESSPVKNYSPPPIFLS